MLLTFETRVAICASLSLALLAISAPLAFVSDRPELWWLVRTSTAVAAFCAVAMVVLNVILHG
jgi:hypothetical protein